MEPLSAHGLWSKATLNAREKRVSGDQSSLTNTPPPVSQHTSSSRQRDGEQQALHPQQYLTHSPASPPEAQPLLQIFPVKQRSIAPTLSPIGAGHIPPPGPLLIGGNTNGNGSSLVPELSVIRIFAGKKLQTEETFRTVLLNSSTSSEELVKQAIQRFPLPAGEDVTDYYPTVKRLEGSAAVLHPEEKPLVVSETLAEAALNPPKDKRSSVGNISSIASNLSQYSAIKKLPMNDFTDDAQVRIYLNKRPESASDDGGVMEEGDPTSNKSVPGDVETGGFRPLPLPPSRGPHNLSTVGVSVPSECFSGPSSHFALQLLIYQDDLPDDMVFNPLTDLEAIVIKDTLRNRTQAAMSSAPFRRKSFMFPKNITVAEVIEISLERFGIPGGIVDGSDEVEDKNKERCSSSGFRYVLNVLVDGKERELMPSGKVIDSYPWQHNHRPADRRLSDAERRSIDSIQFLGSPGGVTPGDPVFILRRVTVPRTPSSRHLPPTPLDKTVLQLLSESIPSSSGASEGGYTNIPHHGASFELHGSSTATQLELTMKRLSEFLSPSVTPTRKVEFKGPIEESLRTAQSMLNEYLHMVKKRDDWWRARLVEEQRRRAVLEQCLKSVVQERGMAERGLRRYLARHAGINSNISNLEGAAAINGRPPMPPLEELGLAYREHIKDTAVQKPSTKQRLFVTDSTVANRSLGAALASSSFTTHSVVNPTSTPFMGTDPVNRDGARLLQTVSTSFTETTLEDIPGAVVEVPAGFAISSEAPARSRRTRLSNSQRTGGKKFHVPVVNPDVRELVCSDDDVSTMYDDENNNCQEESVDIESVSDNGPRSIKTMSKRSFSVQSQSSTINSYISGPSGQGDVSSYMDFEFIGRSN